MRTLVFDVRFKNQAGIGQTVGSDIKVEFYEEGETSPKTTRFLGSDLNSTIVLSNDSDGTLYTTTLDVTRYAKGSVTAKWYATQNGNPVNPYPFVETQANIFADYELTPGDIKTYIRSMLGFPAVAVELTGSHYTTIMEEALTLYSQHIPVERVMRLNYTPTRQVYQLPQLPLNGPFDVKFVRKVVTPMISDPIFGREYLRANEPDLGTMMIGNAYMEMAMRVLNSEPDWRWLHDSKELYINIGPGISAQVYGGFDVSVRYFAPSSMDKIKEDHHRWFKRYCLSQAKKILGQIRGKFSGNVPAPGGPLLLNFESLASEGAQEEAMLSEELRSMAPHVPPVLG